MIQLNQWIDEMPFVLTGAAMTIEQIQATFQLGWGSLADPAGTEFLHFIGLGVWLLPVGLLLVFVFIVRAFK